MKQIKPLIIWEKWRDPFGGDEDIDTLLDEQENEDEEENDDITVVQSKVIVTPMGIIPLSENTIASKIFKFWSAHTNFTVSKNVAILIEQIEGVETLDIYTRYRFRISVGKAFNDREVMSDINTRLYSYIECNSK